MAPPNQQQGAISLAQVRANPKLHSEADEQTQIRIEKGIVEEQLREYFSGPRFRIILDYDTPTIGYQALDPVGKITRDYTLPAANIALHRIEMTDVQPASGSSAVQGGIHSLHLYVHAQEPCPYTVELLLSYLKLVMREMDKERRLYKQSAGWVLVYWGLKMRVFAYARGSLVNMRLEDIRREIVVVDSPEIAPMD